jgi:protein-tyrosine kinase
MSRLKKALEKAKKDFPNIQLYNTENQEPSVAVEPEKKSSLRKVAKVDFSQTKIQPISHIVLKNNRIFALFSNYKVTDQIKALRTQVLKKLEKIGSNTLMVTSANSREGKTFTSINLGISIAQELDRTVLIIDADLKNPAKNHCDFATDFLSIDVEKGLADVLLGNIKLADALINPGIDKLTVLPGGYFLHNSSELLGSPQMELLFKDVKSRYKDRVIIIDTPAILSCADPIVISKFAENILFVVEEEKTSTEDIRQSMNQLSDVNIIGMVINKSKSK